MNFPSIINSPCIPTTPAPPNPQCSDPTFALLNPDICAQSSLLRIKPGILLTCALGSVQFEAFTVTDGTETALSAGVTWSVSDNTVALIGVASGNATGVAPGSVTVTATYQGLTATATLTVLPGMNCCAANDVATMLVVDKSHSMSLQFGAGYSTKQAFADSVASNYALQTNTQKDQIGLIEFDSSPTTDAALTSDSATVSTEAGAIVNSVNKTGIGLALQAAVAALSTSQANTKVIVLITDGEDQDTNPANDPVPIATAFKATGGIIICVGVRSHGAAFNTLGVIATGGFFVNAYPANVTDAIGFVYGLKGYICAGNCTPPGNNYVNEPSFNYSGFANWTAAGKINLLGPGLLDPLPDNGLYVSLGFGAMLTSKTNFTFTAGKQYQLSFFLAGNQLADFGTQNVTVQVGDGTQFQQVIILPSFKAGLTKYSFNFSPVVSVSAPVIITSNAASTAVIDGIYAGPILNDVNLYDISDLSQMFDDDFDMENLQFVPAACGVSVVPNSGGSLPAIPGPHFVDLVITHTNVGGGHMAPGTCNAVDILWGYVFTYVTATGETPSSGSQIPVFPFNNYTNVDPDGSFNSVKLTTPTVVNPRVLFKKIYRVVGQGVQCTNGGLSDGITNGMRLLATIPISQADYTDTFSDADFRAVVDYSKVPPTNQNTTATSAGGYTYYYGYACYGYGCLADPPGAQLQDPNPLPDIEASYVVPTTYTSTQPFTANCPAGTVPMNTVSAIPVLTGYNNPGYDVLTTGDTPGFEAWRVFGTGPGWRTTPVPGFFVAVDVEFIAPVPSQTYLTAAITADSTINGVPVNYQVLGSNDGGATFTTLFQANNVILSTGQQQNFTFTNPGTYNLFSLTMARSDGQALLMGLQNLQYFLPCPTCGGVTKSATATSLISQSNADSLALAAATLAANTALAQIGCATQYSSTQTVTVKCPAGQYDGNNGNGATASGTASSYISQSAADTAARALATANANAILTCNNSNNQTPVSIPAPQFQAAGLGIGSPYPTVKNITGLTGTITRIRVNLLGLIHANQSDMVLLLTGPNGQKVLLIGDCGGNNVLAQSNITLDSASGMALPQFTTMLPGSFKPTCFNAALYSTPFPAPAPGLLPNYSADFSGIIGQPASSANGSWALWCQDIVSLDVGALNNGFTLIIDTA